MCLKTRIFFFFSFFFIRTHWNNGFSQVVLCVHHHEIFTLPAMLVRADSLVIAVSWSVCCSGFILLFSTFKRSHCGHCPLYCSWNNPALVRKALKLAGPYWECLILTKWTKFPWRLSPSAVLDCFTLLKVCLA